MILIDTNIISEVIKPEPFPSVIKWLNEQETKQLYISSITIAEIKFGLYILPKGRRKSRLEMLFETYVTEIFDSRILDFTRHDGEAFAKVMGDNRKKGHPMSFPDGQIATIAKTNQTSIATRNVKDFRHSGIEIINPFE